MGTWYRSGTVAVTNGSPNVVGTGTLMLSQSAVGDIWIGPDLVDYEITSITDDTHWAIKQKNGTAAYAGATASAQLHAVIRNFTSTLPAQLASQLAALMTSYHVTMDELTAWLSGTGSVTVHDAVGNAYTVQTPAALAATIGGRLSKSVAGGSNVTLTSTEAANLFIELTGTLSANINVIVPASARASFFYNATSGAYTLTVKTASGTGIAVPQGERVLLECDGTNIVNPMTSTPGALKVGGGAGALMAGAADFSANVSIGGASGTNHSAYAEYSGAAGRSSLLMSKGAPQTSLCTNVKYDATTGWTYVLGSTAAALYQQSGGGHYWFTAAGGSGAMSLSQVFAIDSSGNLLAGATSGSNHIIKRAGSEGDVVLQVLGSGASTALHVFDTAGGGVSTTNAGVWVQKNSSTNRSGNFAGTINASGADYAEYIRKAIACGLVVKGSLLGFDADGNITDKWSAAISYGIKSTNPNLVGGDVWGAADQVGEVPVAPSYTAPAYEGSADPGAAPVAPQFTLPPEPVQQDGESADTFAVFVAAWQRQCATLTESFAAAQAQHAEELAAWESASAQYRIDQQAHAARVATAESAHAAMMEAYERQKAAFEDRLEQARQTVDRVAFSGIVPVNVQGAAPGDYILAAEGEGDSIIGVVVTKAVMAANMAQYLDAVGRVRRVLPDGRAEVAVIVH